MRGDLPHAPSHLGANQAGFALVLTLLVLVLLTVLVVGFNAATRTEQMAARNFSYQGVASQMADTAVERGLALLNTRLTNGTVSQPGRAWSPDAGFVDLSSAALGGNGAINLNVSQVGGANANETNFFISTNTNPAFFQVPFIEARVSNVPVGRYAFWIDDDGSKMNLNAAWTDARPDFLPTNARPYSMMVFTNFPNLSSANLSPSNFALMVTNTSTNSTLGWSYFFTPRQLMMLSNFGIATYQKLMFHVAGGPGNQVQGTFVLAPNSEPAALDAGGADGMLSIYGGGGGSYDDSYSALITALDAVSGTYLRGEKYESYFDEPNGFVGKYGPDITRQIIANINDATLPGSAASFTGANVADMLAGPDSTGPNNPVPRAVLGLRPSPFLNEIAVGVVQSTNAPAFPAELQIWMDCELVDPYQTGEGAGWEIKYKIRTLRFSGTYELGGQTQSFQNLSDSVDWNWDGANRSVTNNAAIDANGYSRASQAFAFEWQIGTQLPTNASNVVFTQVEVEPVLTVLRRTPGDASTVRDWAISNDFPAGHFVFATIPSVTQALGFNGYGAFAPPAGVVFDRGIAKNDPRVRRFTSYDPPSAAWLPVGGVGNPGVTLGAANPTVDFSSGTGITGLGNDLASAAADIYAHPSFDAGAPTQIIPQWVSAFDLSRIHTGLQWRTLQIRSQDAAEGAANLIPDWGLLEVFTISNNVVPATAKINVNSLVYPAAAAQSAAALATAGLARPLPVAGLFAGNTNAASATNAAINGVNLGIPATAVFSSTGPDSFLAVASNVARLDFSASWRQNRPVSLPTNALGMLAEVLEVDGISNFTTDESSNEGRARGFYDALAASSDVFTIFSVGQALDRNGGVTGETFRRTQVARDPADPARFKVIFSEPLIWE
jgi:hypothetical protein